MANERFSIAIDGPCGAGKSSVAKRAAKRLKAAYLDTGAMYRAVGLYMLRNGVPLEDEALIAARSGDADVDVEYARGEQVTLLNGEDVTAAIRGPEATGASSIVARVMAVRERMVEKQRAIAKGINLVMDGRDIGTCVLPDATLKIYLTASCEARAMRRFLENKKKGREQPYDEVMRELIARDINDTTREISPLRKACDAIEIDSSDMTEDEVVERVIRLLEDKMGGSA